MRGRTLPDPSFEILVRWHQAPHETLGPPDSWEYEFSANGYTWVPVTTLAGELPCSTCFEVTLLAPSDSGYVQSKAVWAGHGESDWAVPLVVPEAPGLSMLLVGLLVLVGVGRNQ